MTASPHIKVPKQARKGQVVLLRAKIQHPMETGWRKNAAGETVPRQRIHKFVCDFEGREVFRADLHSAISTDPYLAFHIKASTSGRFRFRWFEDGGKVHEKIAAMEVS